MLPAGDKPDCAGVYGSDTWLPHALAAARMIAWEWSGGAVKVAGDAASLLGVEPGPVDVGTLIALIFPEDLETVKKDWQAAERLLADFSVEFRICAPGGERWVSAVGRWRDSPAGPQIHGIAQDITGRKRSEREFQENENRYRRIVETAAEAICILNSEGRIVFANRAVSELTGYPPEEILGRPSWDAVFKEDLAEAQARFERRRAGVTERYQIRVRRRDGVSIWADVSSTAMLDDSGRFTGVLLMATNISDRKAAEAELARQREALERTNADLRQFAYVAGHDLQEPLRTIASYAQLLSNRHAPKLGEEGNEFIGFISGAVQRMDALIRDLLAYSRVVNQDALPREEIALDGIVLWAMMNLQHSIRESDAVVRFHDLPTVYGDRTELAQVFQNLLGNAIKYRRAQPPVIDVEARRSGGNWHISVRDNGIGIAPEYHERIFGLFKRLHGKQYDGTGLGLAICKRIVEKHGGRIWVESVPDLGSTFHFTLPV